MKQGEASPSWVLVAAILAIILLLVSVLMYQSLAKTSTTGSQERLCELSNRIASMTSGSKVFGVSSVCRTQTIDIYPDDWDKCSPKFKEAFDRGDKIAAIKSCMWISASQC